MSAICAFAVHCFGYLFLLAALALSTWDVFRPCEYQECFPWLPFQTVCEAIAEKEDVWLEEWWYILSIGIFFGCLSAIPASPPLSRRSAHLMVHGVNVAWILLFIITYAYPPPADGACGKVLKHGQCNKFAVKTPPLASGRASCIMMLLLLLTISRESVWLQKVGLGYPEVVGLHAAAGWWALAQLAVHATGFTYRYWCDGGWPMIPVKFFPIDVPGHPEEPNKKGLYVFYGVLGAASALVLGLAALPAMRRRKYNLFYALHCVCAILFVAFGAQHRFFIILYTFPGLCAYLVDRLAARVTRGHKRFARLSRIAPGIVRVDLPAVFSDRKRHLELGTRWTYVKVPSISKGWHPFSLFGPPQSPSLHIQALGPWSTALLDKAGEHADSIDIKMDGPYGACQAPWQRHVQTCAKGTLVFIAGGTGIVPWADALSGGERSPALASWREILLVWAVRDMDSYTALSKAMSIDKLNIDRLQIYAYITRKTEVEPQYDIQDIGIDDSLPFVVSDGNCIQVDHPHSWTLMALAPMLSVIASLLINKAFEAESIGQGGCGKRGWGPGTSLMSWGGICHTGLSTAQLLACLAATVLSSSICRLAKRVGILSGYTFTAFSIVNPAMSDHSEDGNTSSSSGSSRPYSGGEDSFDGSSTEAVDEEDLVDRSGVSRLTILEGRPDVQRIISEKCSANNPMLVCISGSRPLQRAAEEAVRESRREGRKVFLHKEQSEW